MEIIEDFIDGDSKEATELYRYKYILSHILYTAQGVFKAYVVSFMGTIGGLESDNHSPDKDCI